MTYREAVALDTPDQPKILVFDIETAPALAWVWSAYETNVIAIEQDWYMLSFAYRWLGSDRNYFVGLNQDPDFTPHTTNDLYVVEKLWELFNKADIVVAHNGDKFDIKKANSRFLYHRLDPPTSYRSIDTLKETRRFFNNMKNDLNSLAGLYLEELEKTPHSGFRMWQGCMVGDPAEWRTIKRYNIQDVVILEALYLLIRPWIGSPGKQGHPNLAQWASGERACPKCGSPDLAPVALFRRVHVYTEWRCGNCRGLSRSRLRRKEEQPYEVKLT